MLTETPKVGPGGETEMSAPADPVFNPNEYSICQGLGVHIDAVAQTVYLTIDRGLELPVKAAVPFSGMCLLAASLLQVMAGVDQSGNGGSLPSPGV